MLQVQSSKDAVTWRELWLIRFGVLVAGLNGRGRYYLWFLLAKTFAETLVVGSTNLFHKFSGGCQLQAVLMAVLALMKFVYATAIRPFAVMSENWMEMLISLLELVIVTFFALKASGLDLAALYKVPVYLGLTIMTFQTLFGWFQLIQGTWPVFRDVGSAFLLNAGCVRLSLMLKPRDEAPEETKRQFSSLSSSSMYSPKPCNKFAVIIAATTPGAEAAQAQTESQEETEEELRKAEDRNVRWASALQWRR